MCTVCAHGNLNQKDADIGPYVHKCTKQLFIHLLTAALEDQNIKNSKKYKKAILSFSVCFGCQFWSCGVFPVMTGYISSQFNRRLSYYILLKKLNWQPMPFWICFFCVKCNGTTASTYQISCLLYKYVQ